MITNQIINSIFPVYFNEDTDLYKARVEKNNLYELYFSNDISGIANGCTNLNYNLYDLNIRMDYVTNMSYSFANCYNLTGSPLCENNVIDMSRSYYGCNNLTGNPMCGDNVVNMSYAYSDCTNLNGQFVCGNNVNDMSYSYLNCFNLNGPFVCGNDVVNMSGSYYGCYNVYTSPVCGDNVINMSYSYYNCTNIYGSPVIKKSVEDMSYAYYNCRNIYGDFYCNDLEYGSNSINMYLCFYNRNKDNRLNIHVDSLSKFDLALKNQNNIGQIYDVPLIWNNFNFSYNDREHVGYYNLEYNTWVYPYGSIAVVDYGIVDVSIIEL